MKRTIQAALTLGTIGFLTLATASAQATTYTFADNWKDWANGSLSTGTWSGYSGEDKKITNHDELGHPKVEQMLVDVVGGYLTQVQIVLSSLDPQRELYESLFINTNYNGSYTGSGSPDSDMTWDDWDYFVRDGYSGNPHDANTMGEDNEATDGFFSVNSNATYTLAQNSDRWIVRDHNPNGIDKVNLTLIDTPSVSFAGNTITYTFGTSLQVTDGFFVAYAPWCDNDVIGGGAPVPEPATMLLFGTGLVGLATVSRRKLRQS